jgi:cytochrome P450
VNRPRSIDDLTQLSALLPDVTSSGFPEEFDELFNRKDLRLLRDTMHKSDVVVVFRHRDLRALAAHPFVGMLTEHPYLGRLYGSSVFATNPPRHGPMRQIVSRPLGPKGIQRFSEVAKKIAMDLVDEVAGVSAVEFCSQVADRLAGRFWGALFEMSRNEIDLMIEAAHKTTLCMRVVPTQEEIERSRSAMDSYLDLVGSAVNRSSTKGGNEFLESMAEMYRQLPLDVKTNDFGETVAANVFDGVHTASVAISNSIYALLRSPEHLQTVRADLSHAQRAADEGLRLLVPLVHSPRLALQELEFEGVTIPQGTQIRMLIAAGNRDPEVFHRPNTYDLFRRQLNQVSFGGGMHICPGRHVIGMLVRVCIETVLAPDFTLELVDDVPQWLSGSELRQLAYMPVTMRHV